MECVVRDHCIYSGCHHLLGNIKLLIVENSSRGRVQGEGIQTTVFLSKLTLHYTCFRDLWSALWTCSSILLRRQVQIRFSLKPPSVNIASNRSEYIPLPQGLDDHCFNTMGKSLWCLFWVLYVFFLIQGAYKCNLRAYMMIKNYEKVVHTAEVSEKFIQIFPVETF